MNNINSKWILKKLEEHEMSPADLSRVLEVDRSRVHRMIHEDKISVMAKKAMEYYFKYRSLQKDMI